MNDSYILRGNATLNSNLNDLISLRHHLHQHPELSGMEYETAKHISSFLSSFTPTKIVSGLGSGTGLIALWESETPGPVILFRSELDALPINEIENSNYSSRTNGISHKCGHDGHVTMVCGLAAFINKFPPTSGKIGLLFQPAEETGQGALALVNDERFLNIKPDYIIGLHNLPGFATGKIIMKSGPFCAASCGMRIKLEGSSSHAAEPEKAISPLSCLVSLMNSLPALTHSIHSKYPLQITITHARLGEESFGITPGLAILQITLRAYDENDLSMLINSVQDFAKKEAKKNALQITIELEDKFPVTANNNEMYELVKTAAEKNGYNFITNEKSFRWSEDFGHYSKIAKTAFFGLGAGENLANLHNPGYDFPDELIPYGVNMFHAIRDLIWKQEEHS